ncbi:MAG: TetR/AcrR family transcriptional regulator [Pseudonocardia sp.]|nr:TetR/AcrR family transcriptional regulator [Pseudonocardia sp.]
MPRSDETTRPTRWAGIPAADRVAERRSLLLDAALELLGTEGIAGTTVRAVCATARLNARYFYESFEDLDALVLALFDHLVDTLRAEVGAAVAAAGTDPRARVRATVETTVRFVDSDRRRARVLYVEGRGNERLSRRRLESGSVIAAELEAEAAGRGAGGQIHRITAAFLVGGFSELLMRWVDGAIPVSRDELVEDATELFLGLGRVASRISRAERTGRAERAR